jgi:predicted RecB family nuclease
LRTRSAGQETRATRSGVPRHSGTQPESKAQQHERTVRIEAGHVRLSASDVSNFLACRYLSHLDLLRAGGHIKPPESFDLGFQDIVARGEAHEAEVLDRFRRVGRTITEIPDLSAEDAREATLEAIKSGVDVIFQAVLLRDQSAEQAALYGRPDFLVRAGVLPSSDEDTRAEGPLHYEVVDAKLARSAKARAVLQTTLYSALLAEAQGAEPRLMHLALGNGDFAVFKVHEFAAYERQTRHLLQELVRTAQVGNATTPPPHLYPEPVEHCAICRWADTCSSKRRTDDDLSLVAGMAARQRRGVKDTGVVTRRGFAGLDPLPDIGKLGRAALQQAQLQARLQVRSQDEGAIQYELLAPELDPEGELVPNRGLLALPEPATGDLFFDIEGARYWSEDGKEFGLQYLFGIVDSAEPGPDGAPTYHQIWAFDRPGEKAAFEELVDFITERRRANPGLHVYHYNHYEPTSIDHLTALHQTQEEAIGRLMGRFATKEDELDDLFRGGVFVDLYRVVRQSMRAGVESYSIKRLESLVGYERQIDLRDATENLIAFEASLDEGKGEADFDRQLVVAGYNEDDCRATLVLRAWLEERRAELESQIGHPLPRPLVEEPAHEVEDSEVAKVRASLLDGLPTDPDQHTDEDRAKRLLADLLEWHRREAKPAWWRYFHLRKLSDAELVGEPDAIGLLSDGEIVEHVKKSNVWRLSYPAQEHGFSAGKKAQDPISGQGWTVRSVDDEHGVLELTIGTTYNGLLPSSVIEDGPVRTTQLTARLLDLGKRVVSDGMTGEDSATALLLRLRPNTGGDGEDLLQQDWEDPVVGAVSVCDSLDGSYLPIQGPPGTGKTFTGAEQILALVAAKKTVGITATSHAVISHLIDEVLRHADDKGVVLRVGQRAEKDNPHLHARAKPLSAAKLTHALGDREFEIIGGTPWAWAGANHQASVDTLFVDEAGQMSLANVLAIAGAARNLVLLGDPQQLAQPSQAAHPPGAGASALEHILGDRATMPLGAGLLLDRTWRMHPDLCDYTSEVFYDGRLRCLDGLDTQSILGDEPFNGAGIRIVPVKHEGNTNASATEAAIVAGLVTALLSRSWRNKDGDISALTSSDILVVTPYNAHIREIEVALERAGQRGVKVGTVDKFQGREAPAVIYSMATSSAAEAPRGMEFLYDLHRLNVATSRAKALAIIVASPDLIRVFCGTPRQMVLANALCRAWEVGAGTEQTVS